MDENWEMEEDPWWDFNTQCIRFAVEDDEERYVVSISQIALNDYFSTEDTKDAAFDNFNNDIESILSLAVEFIESHEPNDDGIYFIASEYFEQNYR